MPFLDLEEELEALGYGTAPGRADGLTTRFAPAGNDGRQARYEARQRALARAAGEVRPYRKHPLGTPRHRKGDPEKRRAAARKSAARARQREKERRMAGIDDFMKRLEESGLVEQARMMCVGRGIYEPGTFIPDMSTFVDGWTKSALEARVDFAYWLRNVRGWAPEMIAALFGVPVASIVDRLKERDARAVERARAT